MYLEYLPPDDLKEWILCYWTSTVTASSPPSFQQIYPDGCADIIFNFGGAIVNKSEGREIVNSHSSFVVGTMTRTLLTRPAEAIDLLGIRFKPGALFALTGIPQHEFKDSICPLPDLQLPLFSALQEQLNHFDTRKKIVLLNTWLSAQLHRSEIDQKYLSLLQWIFTNSYSGNVHELSRKTGCSIRKLQRLFQQYVGVSPKEYQLICRFVAVRERLISEKSDSLLEVAVDYGFHDHAHLTHVFKRFAGISPSQYAAR